jgi:hypothetical protein
MKPSSDVPGAAGKGRGAIDFRENVRKRHKHGSADGVNSDGRRKDVK